MDFQTNNNGDDDHPSSSYSIKTHASFKIHRCILRPHSPGLKMYSRPSPTFTYYEYSGLSSAASSGSHFPDQQTRRSLCNPIGSSISNKLGKQESISFPDHESEFKGTLKFVTVKVRSPETGRIFNNNANVDGEGRVVVGEDEHEDNDKVVDIPEEEAVCRFCFDVFREDQNVFKTKCRCKLALAHEECAAKWYAKKKGNMKCDFCDQDTQHIPVTLTRSGGSNSNTTPNSTATTNNTGKSERRGGRSKSTVLHSFRRYSCCFS